jgi:hypothetical protein
MFKKPDPEPSALELVITNLLDEMQLTSCDSEEYSKMVAHLTKLYSLKEQDTPKRVSPETWAMIGGNLAGIMLILQHERFHVITSKALSFVSKLR